MEIAKDTVVALTYRLSTLDGELLEEALAESPAVYLQGGYDGIFPRVEAALEGRSAGAELDLVLEPEDAKVGMQLEGASEDGQHVMLYTVTDVADGKVVVDGNHPLAGQSLRLQCVVQSVRLALAEEIEHGHVHGPHGHHH